MITSDEKFMLEALKLAKKGMGYTYPNPQVGAVLVKNGKIIGRGFHKKAGMQHAEIEAFNNASTDTTGATLYITLEPCNHAGKTPPCAPEIIKRKIAKVVCAIADPNPREQGTSLRFLESAGVQVEVGLLSESAKKINEAFFTFHQKKRPSITLKFAASLDGKTATKTGESKWITNEKMRKFARNLRAEHNAILVGINTVLLDNPHLGVRKRGVKDPLRIILDSTLKITLESDILRDKNVLIVTTKRSDKKKLDLLQKKGIEVLQMQNDRILIPEVMKELYNKKIISVFVEGGAEVLGSFLDAKMVDKIYACYAPIIIGGRDAVTAVKGEGVRKVLDAVKLKDISIKKFDDNFVVIGSV